MTDHKAPAEPAGPKEIVCTLLLCLSTVLMIGLHRHPELMPKWAGWSVWAFGVITLVFTAKDFRRNMSLVYGAMAILGLTEITTDVSYRHMAEMGGMLALAVAFPYLTSRFVFKDHAIRFPFHHGRRWSKLEIFYVLLAVAISYFLLPYYLIDTGAWMNWEVEEDLHQIGRVFIGTNGLGLWDELFFVNICLGVLRRYFRFAIANILQSILFTAFLYELGFTGWGPIMIYCFALLQGLTFRNSESLLYVIVIHLAIDFVLFLALVNAHQPQWAQVFVT